MKKIIITLFSVLFLTSAYADMSDSDKNKINEFINYEREAAIYDLISENYFEVIDVENFSFVQGINSKQKYRILAAAYIDKIRLIDNILID